MNGFAIAGEKSGAGKTLVSSALMSVLSENYSVKPFKAGPDYIDPMFHRFLTGKPSHNLDPVLTGDTGILEEYYHNLENQDIGIIEGVMGLYDGYEEKGVTIGSTAEIAKTLGVPVILVLDARGRSRSIAAVAKGFLELEGHPEFLGIILNRVSSEMLFEKLKGFIEEVTNVSVLGYVSENLDLKLESRHLGLIPPEEQLSLRKSLEEAKKEIKEHVDLDLILERSKIKPKEYESPAIEKDKYSDLTIGVFWDQAFNFYYERNLELLRELGIKLLYISPLKDKVLPPVDGLYIGGGFPEVFAEALSNNKSFLTDLKEKLEGGLPCYAECGGEIYLTEGVEYRGKYSALVGFLPGKSVMTDKLKRFGYADLEALGMKFKIHEFHKTEYLGDSEERLFKLRKGSRIWEDGKLKKNTLAGYPHIHFLAKPDGTKFLETLLDYVKNHRESTRNLWRVPTRDLWGSSSDCELSD